MSCDLEVTNESARCWGIKFSYITRPLVSAHLKASKCIIVKRLIIASSPSCNASKAHLVGRRSAVLVYRLDVPGSYPASTKIFSCFFFAEDKKRLFILFLEIYIWQKYIWQLKWIDTVYTIKWCTTAIKSELIQGNSSCWKMCLSSAVS